jgi:type II secretory ATPase GspE/PulE/Tfp pilus assembly ATPase PilB-like protein
MSAPFDPTKLNLDINSEDSPQEAPKKEIDVSADKQQDDILASIEKTENKPAQNKAIVNELAREKPQDDILSTKKDDIEKVIVETDEEIKEVPPVIEKKEEKKLIDINIANLDNIIALIDEKSYDYVLIEPEDAQVKITFRQDNVDRDVRYVKFPIYTSILFNLKQSTGLVMDDT